LYVLVIGAALQAQTATQTLPDHPAVTIQGSTYQQFRDRLLNIPGRVAAMMAAVTDAARCYEILDAEIREALTGLADSISSGDLSPQGTATVKPSEC
jgi:hypothetical protein